MSTSTVQLRLQLTGQQAQQQLQRINQQQQQAQQQQKQNLSQLLRTQQQFNASVQQGGKYGQQQLRTGQSMVQTNRLLAQILQQQQRQTNTISQQLQQQQRSYQLQLNTLRQQVAAAERLRQQLQQAGNAQRDLNRGGVGGTGGVGTGGNLLGNTAAVVGGVYAGGMIVSSALNEPRQFAESIARSTNTLVSGESLTSDEFNQRVKETERLTRDASLKGGGSAQGMAMAVDKVASDAVFKYEDLRKGLLFDISQAAFASGASPFDIAAMTSANKYFGVSNPRYGLDVAMKQGEMGSFELKDMARYAPALLASAKNAGYSGDQGYKEVLALAQVARMTTGTSGEAATNVDSLFNEFSSKHFRRLVGQHIRLEDGDPIKKIGMRGNKTGFDVTTYMTEMQKDNIGQVEAMARLMERQFNKNPAYVSFQKEYQNINKNFDSMSSAEKAEVTRTLQSQINIIAQSEIGNIFGNKQSLSGFMAYMATRGEGGRYSELLDASGTASGAVANTADRYSAAEWAKNATFDDSAFFTKLDSYHNNSGWLGDLKQKASEWMSSNENLAAHATTAGTALLAMAGMAGVASLAMGKMGAGGMGGSGGKVGNLALTAGQVTLAGSIGYTIGTMISDEIEGTAASDFIGREVAKLLAFFGNDEAQAALDNEWYAEQAAQNDALIQKQTEQNQLSKDLSSKLDTLINATNNISNRPLILQGGTLLDAVGGAAEKQSSRETVIPYKK